MLPVQLSTLLLMYVSYIVFQHNVIIGVAMLNVLIVEDNVPELIALYLKRFGHNTYISRTTIGARLIIEQEKIDAVILDINLPHEEGTKLMPELKSMNIPIIIATAFMDFDYLRKEVFGFLEKPFDYGDLKGLLRRIEDGRK